MNKEIPNNKKRVNKSIYFKSSPSSVLDYVYRSSSTCLCATSFIMTFSFYLKKIDSCIKMLKSCNTVFSDSIEISDCVPPSSDVEQGPEYISITGINNNTAMIINIKTECYFASC
jgi:hypothetical protein